MKFTKIFEKIDALNNLANDSGAVLWLERSAFVFLTVMVLFAPHSIAVTQSAWLIGMLAWVLRMFFQPRPRFKLTALDYALWAFLLWSVISSIFSYAPDISLDKLRGVSLFLIFYFVYHNLKTLRAARFLVFGLILSTMVGVVWMPVQRAIGRGVQIYDFKGSAFEQIGLQEGDAVLEIDGKKVHSLEEMRRRIFENPSAPKFKALIYRADAYTPVEIPRERIKPADAAEESLGINRWKRNRDWRAAGFYGHFTTFAEVLQMIISLTFGIFIASISKSRFFARNRETDDEDRKPKTENRFFNPQILLGISLALMAVALLLTVTRASQLAFLISAAVIVLVNGNRKIMLTLAVLIVPVAIVGLLYLQSARRVAFFDPNDNSTTWRQTVYREGFNLWTSSARNLTLGVGMDSIKRYAREWRLFDDGKLPMGHFHSTPLQLLVERGLPALLIWLTILGIYARTMWRYLKLRITNYELQTAEQSEIRNPKSKIEYGIVLGCFGGMIGFVTSSLVHYNLGDGEVAMVFYLLMGISLKVVSLESGVESQIE